MLFAGRYRRDEGRPGDGPVRHRGHRSFQPHPLTYPQDHPQPGTDHRPAGGGGTAGHPGGPDPPLI